MTTPFEEGNPNAKICILGEAPSHVEIKRNRPLVGPSGELLDNLLHMANIARRECYITNVFEQKVRKTISGNIVDTDGELLWSTNKGFTGTGMELAQGCLQRLENFKGNVIIALGATALSLLYGEQAIMKWRGSVLTSKQGYKIVPTVHPAAVLRGNYLWRYLLISDLVKAKETSDFPEVPGEDYSMIINPSHTEIMEYMKYCKEQKRLATDIECLNHQVSCFCLTPNVKESMCVPLYDEEGRDRWSVEQEAEIWTGYADLMGDESIMKINQNIIFDMGFLFTQNHIHTKGPIGDPMIAHHIMWPDFNKGLDFICSMHTNMPYYKDDGKVWMQPHADPYVFWKYNARDGIAALKCWEELDPLLDDGYRDTYNDTIDLFPSLLFMMARGMKVDTTNLQETKMDVQRKIEEKERELIEVADYEFNFNSPKQCQTYFYIHKGIKPYVSRKTGKPTTDDMAMARIYRRYRLKEAKIIQELRALSKLYGTYLDVQIDKDSWIRSSYNPRGTNTGRLSSSKNIFGGGMNMQNLHPEFKGFLVADND